MVNYWKCLGHWQWNIALSSDYLIAFLKGVMTFHVMDVFMFETEPSPKR